MVGASVQAEVAPAPTPVQASPTVTGDVVKAEIRRVFGTHAEVALCIAKHESGYQEKVTGPKRWVNGQLVIGNTDRWKSLDRGVFQINNHWHAEVSDAEAYNYKSNIAHAYRISEGGRYWSQWATRYRCGV